LICFDSFFRSFIDATVCRGALLTVLATIVGVVVFWSGPDLLAEVTRKRLPVAFYESQGALLTLGTLMSNFLFTAFIR
jgi:hypothetical protein